MKHFHIYDPFNFCKTYCHYLDCQSKNKVVMLRPMAPFGYCEIISVNDNTFFDKT